jgi:hypothetical protein
MLFGVGFGQGDSRRAADWSSRSVPCGQLALGKSAGIARSRATAATRAGRTASRLGVCGRTRRPWRAIRSAVCSSR